MHKIILTVFFCVKYPLLSIIIRTKDYCILSSLPRQVSVIQYARPCDIKKAINDQFSIEFPYLKISLSKLRRLKRDMHKAAEEVRVHCVCVCVFRRGVVGEAY